MKTPDNFLPDWLARCAENRPEHLAVQCDQHQWSFRELDREATRLARQLATIGIQEGNRVALLASNGLPYVAFVHALTRLGAVLVPLNVRLTLAELCWQVQDVQAILLVCDEKYASLAAEIGLAVPQLPRATLAKESLKGETVVSSQPEKDVALRTLIDLSDQGTPQAILYTSGTTGQPKGALITYGMQWWNAIGSALNLGHSLDDRWLACLPLYHIGGLSILMRGVIYGISVVVHEKFDPVRINRSMVEDRITIISVVTVMLQRMLADLDTNGGGIGYPATLRCILLGGGPAPYPLLEACVQRGIPVVQTYGLTESCSQAVTLSAADAVSKLGSAGRPLPSVQLRIMQDDTRDSSPYHSSPPSHVILSHGDPLALSEANGEESLEAGRFFAAAQNDMPAAQNDMLTAPCYSEPQRAFSPERSERGRISRQAASGEPGEIFLKGPTITPGYVDKPEETARAMQDGWFATGDIGYLDKDGYLFVLDRRADLIISGGENVYPAEIESVLQSHPGVKEVGVCGQADAQWGHVPIAFVVPRAGSMLDVEELLDYAAQKLARYKQPRAIYLTEQLPRTGSGKLLRRELPFVRRDRGTRG